MIREVTSIEHRKKYTMPFTAENFQKLYDMKNGQCSLAIKDETRDRPPYSVESPDHFKKEVLMSYGTGRVLQTTKWIGRIRTS
jgi:hypothetical protein